MATVKRRRHRSPKIPLGLEHRAVEITGDENARIPLERMSRYTPVQPKPISSSPLETARAHCKFSPGGRVIDVVDPEASK